MAGRPLPSNRAAPEQRSFTIKRSFRSRPESAIRAFAAVSLVANNAGVRRPRVKATCGGHAYLLWDTEERFLALRDVLLAATLSTNRIKYTAVRNGSHALTFNGILFVTVE